MRVCEGLQPVWHSDSDLCKPLSKSDNIRHVQTHQMHQMNIDVCNFADADTTEIQIKLYRPKKSFMDQYIALYSKELVH